MSLQHAPIAKDQPHPGLKAVVTGTLTDFTRVELRRSLHHRCFGSEETISYQKK